MQWPTSLLFSYIIKSITKKVLVMFFSLSADVQKRTTVRAALPASSSSKLQQYRSIFEKQIFTE